MIHDIPILFMNWRDDWESLLLGLALLNCKRLARFFQLCFSRLGTVAHISPNFFDIDAKSVDTNLLV